jgi:hypothetical protein
MALAPGHSTSRFPSGMTHATGAGTTFASVRRVLQTTKDRVLLASITILALVVGFQARRHRRNTGPTIVHGAGHLTDLRGALTRITRAHESPTGRPALAAPVWNTPSLATGSADETTGLTPDESVAIPGREPRLKRIAKLDQMGRFKGFGRKVPAGAPHELLKRAFGPGSDDDQTGWGE